ncbi:MAG: PorP/SprF family type IX secretion system membrane protein [Chitinophagales bacterium]
MEKLLVNQEALHYFDRMNKIYYIIIAVALLCFTNNKDCNAQDIHYSHITFTPIYTNPAFTGYFDGNVRLSADYRNQFFTILGGSSFQTYSGSADFSIPVGIYGKDFAGAGVYAFHDRVGKPEDGGQFITTSIGLSGSYSKALANNGDHAITIGLSGSFLQRRFEGDALFFGDQFNPNDPENPLPSFPGSNLEDGLSYINFDFSIGLIYLGKLSKKTTLYTGFSIAHLLQPRWAFLDANEAKLPIRYAGQLGFNLNLNKRLELAPFAFYQHQGKIGELVLGNLIDYRIVQSKGFETDLLFGTYFRTLSSPIKPFSFESFIILLGIDYTDLRMAFSYDAQFGGLRDIAKTNSAFEVSLTYTMDFIKSKSITRICPSF